MLQSCVHLNLQLLSFNVPEYRPLQTYFNVETPASLIFEQFVPTSFCVIGQKTVIVRVHLCITALYPPALTLTVLSRDCFHLGRLNTLKNAMLSKAEMPKSIMMAEYSS